MSTIPTPFRHAHVRMRGRDPHEQNRASTPLELLFDLTFVVAISQAGSQFAHVLSLGHIAPAIFAFAFATFSILWAWINFT